MKIEKVNENQIRCFLSYDDLAARQMKISELAYGTEKARSLFHDMMNFASKNCGFDSENLPLMIEAIPLSADTILLTITKVAFPEELDSRFAYFSDAESEEMPFAGFPFGFPSDTPDLPVHKNADDILSVYAENNGKNKSTPAVVRHFVLNSFDTCVEAAKSVSSFYHSANSLYKDKQGKYHLILSMGNHSPSDFNKVCNCLSEYGYMESPEINTYTKIIEHAKPVSAPHALYDLSNL